MGSVFRRKYPDKKTGQERKVRNYSIRFKDADGKWVTEPTEATKKYLAERLLLDREAEVQREHAGATIPLAMSDQQDAYLAELKDAYLADRKTRVKSGTYNLYKERLDFTLSDMGIERISQLTLEAIDSYVNRRLDQGVTPRTVNLQMAVLRRMIQHAVNRELPGVVRNPLARWQPLRETPRKKRRALAPDEAQRLLGTTPVHRRMIWVTALATGMRRKELVLIREEDFRWERGLIVVRPAVAKNGRQRVVEIPEELNGLLREWIERDLPHRRRLMEEYLTRTRSKLAEYEKAGRGDSSQAEALRHLEDKILKHRDHRRLFRNGRGLPYLKSNLLRDFQADLKRAEIDPVGLDLHALRVCNATILRTNGVPDIAIKQRLGHVSIETTDRHYVDLDRVDTGEGTDAVAKFLGFSNGGTKSHASSDNVPASGFNLAEADGPLRPTPDILAALARRYPNAVIGRLFDVSETAVRKWMTKWGVVRDKRQVSKERLTEADIGILRAEVRIMLARSAKAG